MKTAGIKSAKWYRVSKKYNLVLFFFLPMAILLNGCYSYRWNNPKSHQGFSAPSSSMSKIFSAYPNGRLTMEMNSPGKSYAFDPGEKDICHAADENEMRFRRVHMSLNPSSPPGQVLADVVFEDDAGTRVTTQPIDLLRLVPEIDSSGDMQYLELLLEEFHRFGLGFRREHNEFEIQLGNQTDKKFQDAVDRTYRLGLTNNCLDPRKWEMKLVSQDYSDFKERVAGSNYLNQNKTLAHSWFYLDKDLYTALMHLKNPNLSINPNLATNYDELAKKSKDVIVDFDQFRSVKKVHDIRLLEIGHKTGRGMMPLTSEQYYKWDAGIFMNKDEFNSYSNILQKPVTLAQFTGRGFYSPDSPKSFDYDWLSRVDRVTMNQVDQPDTDCYTEIALTGEDSPYKLTLGNIDLASLDEQRYYEVFFGINPYPLSRRNSPPQNTTHYQADSMPDRIKPYFLMTERDSGRWVNNIDKGVELAYIGWESMEKKNMEIYLLSYERITPVWMAKVELNDEMVDRIRVRRRLYSY